MRFDAPQTKESSLFKFALLGPYPTSTLDTKMARVLSIYIDPDTCTCSQACVYECPEVLEVAEEHGVARVREGAERFFESHAEQIIRAADACPVEAIIIELEESNNGSDFLT